MLKGREVLQDFDFSARGKTRVVLWTVLGTIGCVLGAIGLDSYNLSQLDDAERLRSLINDVVLPIVLAGPLLYFFSSKLRELAIAHHKLAIYASTDSLTSVLNRGAFTTLVDAYLEDVRQHERQCGALLVIDVDHFKGINDSFGHDLGDEALRMIALAIKNALRSVDLVGRMGGEEFGVFLPGTDAQRAKVAAERIRQAINEVDFAPNGTRRPLSVSVGGASFQRRVPFGDLYREADRRLYEAKDLGRNRVALSTLGDETFRAA